MNILKNLFENILHPNKPINPQPNIQTAPLQAAPTQTNSPNYKIKNYMVAGVTHYENNIVALGFENPLFAYNKRDFQKSKMYDDVVYQYNFPPRKTELIPEPTNPHDPNAIQVVIDGLLVGYIKAGSCKHILNMMKDNKIISVNSKISGGAYKTLICNDVECTDCELEKGKKNYSIKISITERQ